MLTCVSVEYKLLSKVWVCQYGCCSKSQFKGLEGILRVLGPEELAALLTELMQVSANLGKVSYEPPIVRAETKEAPYLLGTYRGRPFLNSHDFVGICTDSLLRYNVAKELHPMLE